MNEVRTSINKVFFEALESIEIAVNTETFEKIRRRVLRTGNDEIRRLESLMRDYHIAYAQGFEVIFDPQTGSGQGG